MPWYTTADARRDAARQTERMMKQCQIGCNNLADANDLLAMCYGHIGRLSVMCEELRRERDQLKAQGAIAKNERVTK